jgi:hypothetical protein
LPRSIPVGKVVALLKGHESGTKVRSLWAGVMRVTDDVDDTGERIDRERTKEAEWLVSGGFDKRVIIWKVRKLCCLLRQL